MKKVNFGKGVRIKKLRFRVIVPDESPAKLKELEKQYLGKAKPWEMYGEPTGYHFIDTERDINITLEKGKRRTTDEEIQMRKASEELFTQYKRVPYDDINRFFLFECEDADGDEFHMNLGSTKSDLNEYIQEDNLIELDSVQVHVDSEYVGEYS